MGQKIEITLERVKQLLNYDPLTGILTNKVDRGSRAYAGQEAGTLSPEGYRCVRLDNKSYRANRIAWLIMTGTWPEGFIDHKNLVKSDNIWENLRDVSPLQNSGNSKDQLRLDGLPRGVYKSHKKPGWFKSQIKYKHKLTALGIFASPDEAHEAYKKKHLELHGEFSPYFKAPK